MPKKVEPPLTRRQVPEVEGAAGVRYAAFKTQMAGPGGSNRALRWAVEHVPPTGQQRARLEDGLRLVFELLVRRYRREQGIAEDAEISP